ncbi:polyphosphate--glucose phosphotransferase [Flaviflexus equikiangi]|uniref:ROK family protein n=1 Tax=Flaviflexus equikiangi TaxID=2758573 RepID=A0ABS2TIW1_9ACTO|nr:ROK family protein [Flaviflexus equikiangi]MBM9433229.1 ROK family protein [Flaviflexus equikiangi]
MIAFGIDIGGSGIKGAPVDLDKGALAQPRHRIPTPAKSTPGNVADIVKQLVDHFDIPDSMPVGVALPAPIVHGTVALMANLHKSWLGIDAASLLGEALGRHVTVVNDADAAGYGEAEYGAAHGVPGSILVTTLGTGIGSALVVNHELVPNTEFGHLTLPNGKEAEAWASSAVKDREKLSWKAWAKRLQDVYSQYELLLNPDLIIVGGGISKNADKYLPLLDTRATIVPATMRNSAGIIGAAALGARESHA